MKMSSAKPRVKPKEGDIKVDAKGIRWIRRQCKDRDGSRLVNGSRPVFEWRKLYISRCCGEDAFIESSRHNGPDFSNYYVCLKCKKACDADPYTADLKHGKDIRDKEIKT